MEGGNLHVCSISRQHRYFFAGSPNLNLTTSIFVKVELGLHPEQELNDFE